MSITRKTPITRIAIAYMISNAFEGLIMVAANAYFARALTEKEYGYFSNFSSWESILRIFVTLGIESAICLAKYDYKEEVNSFLSSVLVFCSSVGLFLLVVFVCFSDFWVAIFSISFTFLMMLVIHLIFVPAYSFYKTYCQIYQKYVLVSVLTIVMATLKTVTAVLLVMTMSNKLEGRIIGYIIPTIIISVVLWIYIVCRGRCFSIDHIRYACRISMPLIPHQLSSVVLGSSDQLMITKYVGSEQTAIYAVPYQITFATNVIWTSMNQAWTPWLFDHLSVGNIKVIRKKAMLFFACFELANVGLLLISPELLFALGGSKYSKSLMLIPPMITGISFQFLYGLFANLETYAKRTGLISVGTVIAAIINVCLNREFIPRYGYYAAAITTLVSYIMLFLLHFFFCKTMIKEYSDIFNGLFVIASSSVIILVGFFSAWVYYHFVLRIVTIIVFGMVISCVVIVNKRIIVNSLVG